MIEHWRKNKKGNIGNQNNLEVRKRISKKKKGKNIGKDNVMSRPEIKLKHKRILNLPHIRKKISMKCRGHIPTEEHKRKNSETKKGKNNPNYGKIYNKEEKYQRRIKALNNIKKFGGPKIGKNEKRILDELELSLNKKIIRQYQIRGYTVDGYISKLNLCIEIDEKGHMKNKEKDNIRQKYIQKELNCKFLRIKDY